MAFLFAALVLFVLWRSIHNARVARGIPYRTAAERFTRGMLVIVPFPMFVASEAPQE